VGIIDNSYASGAYKDADLFYMAGWLIFGLIWFSLPINVINCRWIFGGRRM
jgi:hypothetical protein